MLSVALIACFTGRLSLPNKHPAKEVPVLLGEVWLYLNISGFAALNNRISLLIVANRPSVIS